MTSTSRATRAVMRHAGDSVEPHLGIIRLSGSFRKTATEYDQKPGVKWLSCTAQRQTGVTLAPPRCRRRRAPARAGG